MINAASSQHAFAVRGGKKKKGGTVVEGPLSSDIVNIWKDKPDPVIKPTEDYPIYVAEALKPQYTGEDIIFQLYRGERLPEPKESWTLAKNMRRQLFVDSNKTYKRDIMYESDEDEGEDLGQNVEFDQDDEFDSDDEDAPKKVKTEEELLMEAADK